MMSKKQNLLDIKKLITHIKDRILILNSVMTYYENIEKEKEYLTTDQRKCYEDAVSRFRELEKLISYMETGK